MSADIPLFGAKAPTPVRGRVFYCRKTKEEMVVTQIGKGVIYYRPLEGKASFCVQAENWKHVAAEALPNTPDSATARSDVAL